MVNSRQLHYGFSSEHDECEFICILLSTELLQGNEWFYENFIEHITENSLYPYLYLDSNGWQIDILEKLDKLYHSFGDTSIKNLSYFELTSLRNMITYIEEHFTEHITLKNIALAGACCKSRCSLLFKKYLHDTPITYTTKLRLRKSLSALLDSDACITDIAYKYGFCGASYYCETFQKYYGISPLKYRNRNS